MMISGGHKATGQAQMQIFDGPGQPLRFEAHPLPDRLAHGEVLVATSLATICGSDLHTTSGRRKAPVPCVLGHEAVGRVIATSEGRTTLDPGTRVTWTLVDSCGSCSACRRDHLPEKCHSLFKYGHAPLTDGSGLNGCYSSHVLLRAGTHIVHVPDAIPDAVVVPANCALATMVNVISQIPDGCETIVIQGAGLLGLYACALLHDRGVRQVFCIDLSEERLQYVPLFAGVPVAGWAEAYPATRELILDAAPGGVDAVVEVAGSADVVPEGVRLLRPGGFYALAGMVHPDSVMAITGEQIIRKCLTIRGTHNYSPVHLDQALAFLARTVGQYPYERLVSPAFELGDLRYALQAAATQKFCRVAVESQAR